MANARSEIDHSAKVTPRHDRYVAKETAISVVINCVISAVFVWLMFGDRSDAPLWGWNGLAVDFVPQTFMIALMGTLVPSAITRRRIRAGNIGAKGGQGTRLPRHLFVRSIGFAVSATILLAPVAIGVLTVLGVASLPFTSILALKILYGALVAIAVTPIAVRAVLRENRKPL
jgi:hypothetical protein